jgi:hypothetical protein
MASPPPGGLCLSERRCSIADYQINLVNLDLPPPLATVVFETAIIAHEDLIGLLLNSNEGVRNNIASTLITESIVAEKSYSGRFALLWHEKGYDSRRQVQSYRPPQKTGAEKKGYVIRIHRDSNYSQIQNC